MMVVYSCLATVNCFLRYISLLKIINDEIITKPAPIKVFIVGISPQIRYPKNIAKTKAKYLRGVTNDTSEYLYAVSYTHLTLPTTSPV